MPKPLPISLSIAIELHKQDCTAQRFSPRTVQAYRERLAYLQRFLVDDIPLSAITQPILRAFMLHLVESGKSDQNQHAIARGCRAFFNYAVRDGLLEVSPWQGIRMPRLQQKVKATLTAAECERIVKACESARDKALVLLLLSSGIRAQEACDARIEDVDLASGTLHIRTGKGGKGRVVMFDAKTRKALMLYLSQRKQPKPDSPLLQSLTRKNGHLQPHSIAQIFAKLRKTTGIAHATAHACRRTFATNAIKAGMPVSYTAKLMGHNDPATLLRHYVGVDDSDVADSYKAIFR